MNSTVEVISASVSARAKRSRASKPSKVYRKPNNQNDLAERLTAERLGLIHNPGRMGIDAHDEFGNGFEFKSKTKPSCSTSRDCNRQYIAKNRKLYWIIVDGYHEAGTFVIEKITFFAPVHLAGFWDPIDAKLAAIEATHAHVIDELRAHCWDEATLSMLAKQLERGSRENDPSIPASYIEAHGIDITADPVRLLRENVARFPIEGGVK